MADYATLAELKPRLLEAAATDDPVLSLILSGVSRAIDRSLKVPDDFFAAASGGATNKTVASNGRGHIVLPPLVAGSLASVTDEFGRVLTAPEYRVTENYLYALSSSVKVNWLRGVRYTISAQWGWVAIPADIKEACLMIAASWFRSRDPAWQKASDIDIRDAAIPPEAEGILDRFRSELIRRGWVNP